MTRLHNNPREASRNTPRDTKLNDFIAKLMKKFPSEDDWVNELHKKMQMIGMVLCHHCGNTEVKHERGKRVVRCIACGKLSWFTAGTLFHKTKCVRPLMLAIFLMENGFSSNAFKFHRLVGIAYASAWAIFKKVTSVIQEHIVHQREEIPSSFFAVLFCKRSRVTPARQHPRAEQDEFESHFKDADQGSWQSTDAYQTIDLSDEERSVYFHLCAKPISFDNLSCLTDMAAGELSSALMMLELAGMVEKLQGDRYVRCLSPVRRPLVVSQSDGGAQPETPQAVGLIIDFIRTNFGGISRKYLQNFIAAYWCQVDRVKWHKNSLLRACLRGRPFSKAQISTYVTPALLRIASSSM
jgi:hypothetical protein